MLPFSRPSRRLALLVACSLATAVLVGTDTASLASGAGHSAVAITGPSWASVMAARSDEAAKQKAVSEIKGAIAAGDKAVAGAQSAADTAGARYQEVQERADVAAGRLAQLDEQRQSAQHDADRLMAASGRLAAGLSRKAGGGGVVESIVTSDPSHDVLYALSVSGQVSSRFDTMRTRATAARRVAQGLTDQANRVAAEHSRFAELARTQFERASAASVAAAAQLDETTKQKATLDAQLAVLHDERLSLEDGYRKAEAERAARAAEEAERARQEAAAAEAAKPKPPPPGVKPPAPGPGPVSPAPDPSSGWVRAITSYNSYQGYGYRWHPITHEWRLHAGADFGAALGTAIYSVASGKVTFAGRSGGYGTLIVIDHGGGISSAYGHMRLSSHLVKVGQTVTAGQPIAGVGNEGDSTGPHLHLEIRRNGTAIDPMVFLLSHGA